MLLTQQIYRVARLFVQEQMSRDNPKLMPRFKHEEMAWLLVYSLDQVLRQQGFVTSNRPISRARICSDHQAADSLKDILPTGPDALVKVCQGSLYIYMDGHWVGRDDVTPLVGALSRVPVWRRPDKTDKKTGIVDVTWQQSAELEPMAFNWPDITGIAKAVKKLEPIRDDNFFDQRPVGGVCLNDGFLKIEKVSDKWEAFAEEHSPHHRATFKLPLDMPDFKVEPFAFIRHLETCYKGDQDKAEKVAVVQEWLGMAITGFSTRISDARCLLLQGKAASGKSIIHEVVEAFFPTRDGQGNRLVESQSPDEWNESGNSGDFKRCKFQYVVLNSRAELPNWRKLDRSDVFKSMITGDPISARFPGEQGFSFTPRAAHIYSNNTAGQDSPDQSDGFFRRFLIVSHNRSFAKSQDARNKTDYVKELTAPEEMKALLGWGIKGALRLLRNGERYTTLESSDDLVDGWKRSSDPFMTYWEDCVLTGPIDGVEMKETFHHAFKEYRDFCRLQQEKPFKRGEFELKLKSLGISVFHCVTRNQKMVQGMRPRDGTGTVSKWGSWRDDFAPRKEAHLRPV